MSAKDLMTRLSDELPDLLTDIAAPREPDYTDELLARFASTRQRPRWSFPGRWLPAGVVARRPAFASGVPWRPLAVAALLLLAAAAAAAVFVGSRPHLPPPFGIARPGAIAYVADGEIWRANADGSNAIQLTNDPRIDTRPVFSRDGTKLAITRLSKPGSHPNWEEWSSILIADAAGGHPVLIDDDQEGISPITWSSDGRFIVYSKVVDGSDQIVVAMADGSSTRVITSGQPSWGPVLAPDDLRIAFADGSPDVLGVSLIDIDGSNRRLLVRRPLPDFDLADWSPNGRVLVYAAGPSRDGSTDLWLIDAAAGTERPLVATPGDQYGPVWSPDGGKIAYLDESDPRGSRVMVVGADGLDPHAISGTGGWTYPQWSPDARRVIATDAQFGHPPTVLILDPSGHDPAASFALPDVTGAGRGDQPTWQRLAL